MRPEHIPDSMVLAVPEPDIFDAAEEPMRRMLKYTVQIRVRWLLLQMPPDLPLPSPPPTPPTTESSEDESSERAPHRARSRERKPWRHQRTIATPPTPESGRPSPTDTPADNFDGGETPEPSRAPQATAPETTITTREHEVNSGPATGVDQMAPTFKMHEETPTTRHSDWAPETDELILCSHMGAQREQEQVGSNGAATDPMLLEAEACTGFPGAVQLHASNQTCTGVKPAGKETEDNCLHGPSGNPQPISSEGDHVTPTTHER